MRTYELFEHTADIGFKVYGRDMKDLFENAGRAFAEVLADEPPRAGEEVEKIALEGTDPEDLLVRFLGELLYLFHVKELIAVDAAVSNLTDTELEATLTLARFDLETHGQNYDVKAVTYHDIKIEQTPDGLEARVIFDI